MKTTNSECNEASAGTDISREVIEAQLRELCEYGLNLV